MRTIVFADIQCSTIILQSPWIPMIDEELENLKVEKLWVEELGHDFPVNHECIVEKFLTRENGGNCATNF